MRPRTTGEKRTPSCRCLREIRDELRSVAGGRSSGPRHGGVRRHLPPQPRRPGGLLARGRRRHRLDRALRSRARPQSTSTVTAVVPRRRAQHVRQRRSTATSPAGAATRSPLVYDSPVTGRRCGASRTRELRDEVARFAGALAALGVGKGDTVIIYMPMVPEAVVAMLACARLGAVHSVVFGGFAPNELAMRIDDAKPKVIVSASCGIEVQRVIEYKPLLDLAIEAATHKPDACVILHARHHGERHTAAGGDDGRRPRPRLGRADGGGRARTPCVAGGRHRPALHPLHVGHHREAEGRGARQRRPRRGAALEHAQHLRHPPRRGVLGRLRRRLGRRPQLHRLRPAAHRLHDDPVRGQAGRHARPGRVLAGRSPSTG